MTFSLFHPQTKGYYVLGGRPTRIKAHATKYFTKEDAENVALFRNFPECVVEENEEIQWPTLVHRENDSVLMSRFGEKVSP
jgi:hypothetical protein